MTQPGAGRLLAVLIANGLLRIASSAGGALIGFYLAALARAGRPFDAGLVGALGVVVNVAEVAGALPVGLLADVTTGLESRAQARRVALRLAAFRRAELDFTGIEDIGQGFADELFRVVPATQPTLELVPVGIAPRVAEMIRSVQAA